MLLGSSYLVTLKRTPRTFLFRVTEGASRLLRRLLRRGVNRCFGLLNSSRYLVVARHCLWLLHGSAGLGVELLILDSLDVVRR